VAVNQSLTSLQHVLDAGDELALIPPVAGGSRHAILTDEPPSATRCTRAVSSEAMGGIVTFTGVVRRHSRGKRVERLHYEAYREMAEKVLHELCAEIESELPGCRLAVEHRIGTLDVGDIAVAIAAAAPHRKEAFTACEAMIDRLKERVPIWKKEHTDDGAEWIGLGP
jgi:molybdopterin synthase catalytic subunit